jgi:hypothetical protein
MVTGERGVVEGVDVLQELGVGTMRCLGQRDTQSRINIRSVRAKEKESQKLTIKTGEQRILLCALL